MATIHRPIYDGYIRKVCMYVRACVCGELGVRAWMYSQAFQCTQRATKIYMRTESFSDMHRQTDGID